jgi:hypothetical protein
MGCGNVTNYRFQAVSSPLFGKQRAANERSARSMSGLQTKVRHQTESLNWNAATLGERNKPLKEEHQT